jgi:N-acetylglutamate synthase-like GNAT family acetyltransferase
VIRACRDSDVPAIDEIVNQAAQAYRGVIPEDCWHEPYMSRDSLLGEIASGVRFSGWDRDGRLMGVMGLQLVRDATLIRHAYVRPDCQGEGIGSALLTALLTQRHGRLLVGTWAAAAWAIRFYERHGFRLVPSEDKDNLLQSYWNVPPRQRQVSVVLVHSPENA